MDGDDANEEFTLEVEEAELSSSEEERDSSAGNIAESGGLEVDRPVRKNSSPAPDDDDDDDLIVEEEDDVDGDKMRDASQPNGVTRSEGESSSPSSDRDNHNGPTANDILMNRHISRDNASSDENSAAESDYVASNDGEPQTTGKGGNGSNGEDSDYAQSDDGDASGNSDVDSDAIGRPKRSNTRRQHASKLVIPKDMLDDTQYFRRSNRTRNAPARLSGSRNASDSSEEVPESDSDFVNDGKLLITISYFTSTERQALILTSFCCVSCLYWQFFTVPFSQIRTMRTMLKPLLNQNLNGSVSPAEVCSIQTAIQVIAIGLKQTQTLQNLTETGGMIMTPVVAVGQSVGLVEEACRKNVSGSQALTMTME